MCAVSFSGENRRLAKFKPARPKQGRSTPQMRQGIPCLVMIGMAMLLVALLIFAAMRYEG